MSAAGQERSARQRASALPQHDAATDPARFWRAALTLGVLALALRLAFIFPLWPLTQRAFSLSHGSDGYELVARTVVAGAGYKFAPHLGETMILTPTYPLALAGLFALVGEDVDAQRTATQILQCVLDALTTVMILALGKRWHGATVGVLAALLYACYPGMWVACARYVTEPLFNVLVVAFMLTFAAWMHSARRAALVSSALLLAAASMCKSIAAILPLFLITCVLILPLFWRRGFTRLLTGLACCAALTSVAAGAWLIRNHQVSGHWVYPSTLSGQALYTATVYVAHPEQSIRESVHQAAREMHAIANARGFRLDPGDSYPRWFFDAREEVAFDRALQAIARERIAADQTGFARHLAGNLWRFWFGAPSTRAIWMSVAINGPLLILALAGALYAGWLRRPEVALWLAAGAYFFLSHVSVLAVVRYSLIVMPMVCLLAGVALVRWWRPGQLRQPTLDPVWSVLNKGEPA